MREDPYNAIFGDFETYTNALVRVDLAELEIGTGSPELLGSPTHQVSEDASENLGKLSFQSPSTLSTVFSSLYGL